MSNELHKYPGNLRHHKVDGDIDEDTALLISNLAAEVVRLRDASAKDAELIAFILKSWRDEIDGDGWVTSANYEESLAAAATAGFKPSEQ